MKIREFFVSNSSSTSFAVAVNPGATKGKILIEVDLANYGKTITSLEQLKGYYKENYLGGDEFWEEIYRAMQAEIEAGRHVIIGDIPDYGCGGDDLSTTLREQGLEKVDLDSMEILYEG